MQGQAINSNLFSMVTALLGELYFQQRKDLLLCDLMEEVQKQPDEGLSKRFFELTLHPEFQDDFLNRTLSFLAPEPKTSQTMWVQLAKWFEEPKNFLQGALPYRFRFAAECWVLELEQQARDLWLEKIKSLWRHRQTAIRSLVSTKDLRFDWNPQVRNWLIAKGQHHQGEMPLATMLTSLRYFLSLEDPSLLKPTLLDFAIFLLFLGNQELGINLLEVRNTPDEIVDLCSSLIKIHRTRLRFFQVDWILEEAQYEELALEIENVLQKILKVEFQPTTQRAA